MTMPLTGQISLDDARTEMQSSGQITLNDTSVRNLFGRRSDSTSIGLSNGYGRVGGSLFTFENNFSAPLQEKGKFYSIDPNEYTSFYVSKMPYYNDQYSTNDIVNGVYRYQWSGVYAVANSTDTMCQLWGRREYVPGLGAPFFGMQHNPLVITSKNYGATWTSTVLPHLGYPYASATNNIRYVGNKFFILYGRSDYTCSFFYSTDGVNWSYSNPPVQASRQRFHGIGFDGTYYRAYGQTTTPGQPIYSVVSTDGVNWSTGPSFTSPLGNGDTNWGSQLTNVQYGGGKWLMEFGTGITYAGINGTNTTNYRFFMHSSDGVNWSLSSGHPFYGNSYLKFYGSASYLGNNTWMCNCRDAEYNSNKGLPFLARYIRSTDGGATWTSTDCPGGGILSGTTLTNLQFGDQWFLTRPIPNGVVYAGWGNYIYVSYNYGLSWTQKYTITNGTSSRLPTFFL